MDQNKIIIPMRKRTDKTGNVFYIGRPRMPINVQLDRFVVLCFPFFGNGDGGAELVFELAHEDVIYRNAARLVRRVVDKKIKDQSLKLSMMEFLDDLIEEELAPPPLNRSSHKFNSMDEAISRISQLEEELSSFRRDELMAEYLPEDKK